MASRKLAVVVTGGRDYGVPGAGKSMAAALAERQVVLNALEEAGPSVVLHGGAKGADAVAAYWCKAMRGVWVAEYPAEWEKFGKIAGPKRNGQMCDDLLKYKADGYRIALLAFPGGAGTASCVTHAERRGIPVWRYPEGKAVEGERQ